MALSGRTKSARCAHRWAQCGLGAALLSVLVGGCAAPPRQPVPADLQSQAQAVGHPDVRAWGDKFSPLLQASLVESVHQVRAIDPRGLVDATGAVNVLALSGGGSYGAFGAGLLCGWTAAGTRPTFKLVTGISTGSLIAPFAFLGSEYDHVIRDCYTHISTRDIYTDKSLLGILIDNQSLVDNTPLRKLIAEQIDEKVFNAIAEAHRRGRRLFVGTTNLDAGRLVIWDMGAIAASGRPGSIELFRRVLLASASIPVAFPPVFFDAEAGGKLYDEMHVDGGVATQVFFYGFTLDLPAAIAAAGVTERPPPVRLFVVRNGVFTSAWKPVLPRLLPIASRTVSGLIGTQGVGDLFRIYTIATRDGIEFNLAAIPSDFKFTGKESFDTAEMNRLFDLGYEMARGGYPWQKLPPGLDQRATAAAQ